MREKNKFTDPKILKKEEETATTNKMGENPSE